MFEGLSAGFETLRHTQNKTERKKKKSTLGFDNAQKDYILILWFIQIYM